MDREPKKLITIVLILLLSFQMLYSTVLANYPMYSGDATRTRNIQDTSMDTPILYKWNLNIGWSVSQPIVVDGFIYHIAAVPDDSNDFELPAGSYLYRLPILQEDTSQMTKDQILQLMNDGEATAVRLGGYTKTYSHITWSEENQAFYLGWGTSTNGKIFAIGKNLDWQYYMTIGATMISAPYVLSDDIAVFGAMNGTIYAIKGLKTDRPSLEQYKFSSASNAEITANITAIPGTNSFGTALNFRSSANPGQFRLFDIVDNGLDWKGDNKAPSIIPKWDSYYTTSTGVSTDAAYDADRGGFYFSDKYGAFYAVSAWNGQQIWKVKYPQSQVPVTLINNSPAMGDENIYFPLRKDGGVAALKKDDGSLYWYAAQGEDKLGKPVDANVETGRNVENNTTIWKTKSGKAFVLYGDDKGQLTFLDFDGNRAEIARTTDGSIESSIRLAQDDSVPPANRSDWAVQGNGLATEVVIDSSHFLFGVNNNETGALWAYSVGATEDVSIEFDRTLPSDPLTPGTDNSSIVQVIMRHNLNLTEPLKTKLKYTFDKVHYTEQDVMIQPQTDFPKGQPIKLLLPWKVPLISFPFHAVINSNDDAPAHEENRLNNIVDTVIHPQRVDLSLVEGSWRLEVDTPQKNVPFGVYVKAHMDHLDGVSSPVKTIVSLKLNGVIEDEKEILIEPGETKEIGPFYIRSKSKSAFLTAEINPYKDRPSYEPNWKNNVIKEHLILQDGIDLYVSKVKPPDRVVPNQLVQVEATVGNHKLSTENATDALVRAYFDKQLIEERRVALNINEAKNLTFSYRVPDAGNHTFTVTINEDFLYPELTYTNNSVVAGIQIYSDGKGDIPGCGPTSSSAIVNSYPVTDKDGKYLYTHDDYEYLSASVINQNGKVVKAGQAIDFQVTTSYSTEYSSFPDVEQVYVVFPGLKGESAIKVQMEPNSGRGSVSSSTTTWSFPQVWLEEWSGKVLNSPDDPQRDLREDILDGGRKFYTDMKTPDGPYPYKIVVEGAGKNSLSQCMTNVIDVQGGFDTFTKDEHYIREVLPNTVEWAFPYGTQGTHWEGKEEVITNLRDWYLNPYEIMTEDDYDTVPLVIQNGQIVSGWLLDNYDMDEYDDLNKMYYGGE